MTTIFKNDSNYHKTTSPEFGSFPCLADNTINDNSLFKTLDTNLQNTFAIPTVQPSRNGEPFPVTLYSSTACGEPFPSISRTFPVFDKECSTIRTTIAVIWKLFATVSETPETCCQTFATIGETIGTCCGWFATISGALGTYCRTSATVSESFGTCSERSAVIKKTSPAIREPIIDVSRPARFPVLPDLPGFENLAGRKIWQVEKRTSVMHIYFYHSYKFNLKSNHYE